MIILFIICIIPLFLWLFDLEIFKQFKINFIKNEYDPYFQIPAAISLIFALSATEYENSFGHEYLYYLFFCVWINFHFLTFIFIINLFELKYGIIKQINRNFNNINFILQISIYLIYLVIIIGLFVGPSRAFAKNTCKQIDKFWHIEEVIYDEDEQYEYEDRFGATY